MFPFSKIGRLECEGINPEGKWKWTETQAGPYTNAVLTGAIDKHQNRPDLLSKKHRVFPYGHPSSYKPNPTGVNLGEREETSALLCQCSRSQFGT